MKSVMTPQEHFSRVASPQIERSTFDRSHGYKTTFDAGKLIPFFVDEALPGDTINLRASIFGRLATPIKPIMDNIVIDIHFFSVPLRLLWDNWQRFNGEQRNPDDSTNFIMPVTKSSGSVGYAEGSLADYMGLPTKIATPYEHRADFFRAYNLIWNEWYRDENLQNSIPTPTDDGPDPASNYQIRPRGKRKDYFTSALPWAQKAQPVSIPLGTSAPLQFTLPTTGSGIQPNQPLYYYSNANNAFQRWDGAGTQFQLSQAWNILEGANLGTKREGGDLSNTVNALVDISGQHSVDLSNATAVTINALREAFQIQRMYEKDARGGTRYTELLRSHFGVISPDARLQRPEYLGGGSAPVNISPIAQTEASVDNLTPQGNLAAMGTFSLSKKGFVKSFLEHEIVIGLASARADLNYQQGMNRMWSRSTRFDFYWPSLAHLGEQAILNKEIFLQGTSADDNVFGYQERYAEYRYKPSQVTGLFRSNAVASLDIWHLSQDFASLPALNANFIVENPPIDRIIATPEEPQFMADFYIKQIHSRPMPTFGTPGLIDHF